MLNRPFLTDLDSRAAVKGSRDPLGIQPIWTRLGRHVVGNLTTVSTSVLDFTSLLLGCHFTARLAEDLGPGTELGTFLKWEQLAAYARALVNQDYAFRGTERVRKNLSESPRITLSADRAHQILGNQKIYGLWGLYTGPGRVSGLVEGDPPRLTAPAQQLVERHCLPILEAGGGQQARRILDLLGRKDARLDTRGPERPMLEAIARALQPSLRKEEREFYRFHLLHGGPLDKTEGRQQQFAELLQDHLGGQNFAWSSPMVLALAKEARDRGDPWHPLADRLVRIGTCETVLAPATALFSHLLGLHGKTMSEVAGRLKEVWGSGLTSVKEEAFAELRGEIALDDWATGERWVSIASALRLGRYAQLLELLLEQNKAVMASRGGAPWMENRHGILHVLFQERPGPLPRREEIGMLWRSSYFLDSLRLVALALKENQCD